MELHGHKLFIKHDFVVPGYKKYISAKRSGMTVIAIRNPSNRYLNSWIGEPTALVSIAFCSMKDSFSRKKGVEVALNRQPELVRIKDLPEYLAAKAKEANYYSGDSVHNWQGFALSIL